jgi:hypothetical protein
MLPALSVKWHRLAIIGRGVNNRSKMATPGMQEEAFSRGSVVLVTLNNPREKFWGAVIAVSSAGVSLRGIDLNSFEDFTRIVKAGEPGTLHSVFFPMHRIERMEIDSRNGDIPSMQERFESRSGKDFSTMVRDAT